MLAIARNILILFSAGLILLILGCEFQGATQADILDQAPTAVPTIKIDDDATGTDSTEDFGQNPSVDEISGKEVADVKEVHLQDTNRYESKTAQQSEDVDDKGDGLQHEFDNLCWTEEDLKNLEKIRSCEGGMWPTPTPTPNLDIKEVDKIAAEKVEKAVIERKIATPTPILDTLIEDESIGEDDRREEPEEPDRPEEPEEPDRPEEPQERDHPEEPQEPNHSEESKR